MIDQPFQLLNRQFVAQVELRRKALGLTRKALASVLGKSPAFVTQILDKDANLTLKTIAEIAEKLEIKLSLSPTLH